MTLSYGAFEAVLHVYITPRMTKLSLANILLLSPMVDARRKDKEFLRKANAINSATVTRIRSGERGVPRQILEHYSQQDALEYIKLCFSLDIVPHVPDRAKKSLLLEVLALVQQDEHLSLEEKMYFEHCAAEEALEDFLAEVFLCAINPKAISREETRASNLPQQNRFFYGREDELSEIAERFQNGASVQGLFGMGGVGKTQIALQYAHIHQADYDFIWWINAENSLVLQNSVSAFLTAQKALPKKANAESSRTAFLNYLDKHGNWLLIYDNAEYGEADDYETLKDYFPQNTSNGHVLLTTRCRNGFEDAVQLEIPVFDVEAAVTFLERRTGRSDSVEAAKLAQRMGCLPLALEYAAAYIRETPGVDYASYAKKLDQYSVKVLDRRVGQITYKMTVREAFHVTLDKLMEDAFTNPVAMSAAQFLNICAYLAPDGIELAVFAKYGGHLPEPVQSVLRNELDRDELIRNLTRYSLMQFEWNTLSIHRLLQEVLRDEINSEAEMLCINSAYGVFYGFYYDLHVLPIETSRQFLISSIPHVQAILTQYVRRCRKDNPTIPDKIMVAKEYFSWTGFLLSDAKKLSGDELVVACQRDNVNLQAAVDFYDSMAGKTIYLSYTRMLLAQTNAMLEQLESAAEQYTHALAVLEEVVAELDVTSAPGDTLQALYQKEVFQLGADICAAIASSKLIYSHIGLLWYNYKTLTALVQKQLMCHSKDMDTGSFLTLQIYSRQVASYTHRAFMLRLQVSRSWLIEREMSFLDGLFFFFRPTETIAFEATTNVIDGFDLMLGDDMDGDWSTLAFPEDVRTEADMLQALMETKEDNLAADGKRALYSAIYLLTKQLRCEDVAIQYEKLLLELGSL